MADGRHNGQTVDPVLRKLDAMRRSLSIWMLGWGYLWVVLLVCSVIFVGVLVDHAVVLQKWGRLAFFRAFLATSVIAVLAASLYPFLRRVGRLYIARLLERENGDLQDSLISYLQCRKDPQVPTEVKLMLMRRAAPHVASADPGIAVDVKRYVHLALAVGLALAAFFVYGLVSPKSASVSLSRLLHPRADILPPTATRLTEIEPGSAYVIRGSAPRASVMVRGARPDSVAVVWAVEGRPDHTLLLTEGQGGLWQGSFPPILEDGAYHITAGDTRSERFRLLTVPTPAVTSVELKLVPPAYTGLPPRTVEGGNVEVVAGTVVNLRAVTNVEPRQGYVTFGSGLRAGLVAVPAESALTGQFTVTRTDTYTIQFQTRRFPDGSSFTNPSPLKFRIVCREDAAPEIELLAPADGAEVGATDTVTLVYSASDDYGLDSVRLHYRMQGLDGPPITVAEPDGTRLENATHGWDLSSLNLRRRTTIGYYLEARDNWPNLAHTARSETRTLVVLGPEPDARPADPEDRRAEAGQGEAPERVEQRPAGTPDLEQPESEPSPEGEPGNLEKIAEYIRTLEELLPGEERDVAEAEPAEQPARDPAAGPDANGDRPGPEEGASRLAAEDAPTNDGAPAGQPASDADRAEGEAGDAARPGAASNEPAPNREGTRPNGESSRGASDRGQEHAEEGGATREAAGSAAESEGGDSDPQAGGIGRPRPETGRQDGDRQSAETQEQVGPASTPQDGERRSGSQEQQPSGQPGQAQGESRRDATPGEPSGQRPQGEAGPQPRSTPGDPSECTECSGEGCSSCSGSGGSSSGQGSGGQSGQGRSQQSGQDGSPSQQPGQQSGAQGESGRSGQSGSEGQSGSLSQQPDQGQQGGSQGQGARSDSPPTAPGNGRSAPTGSSGSGVRQIPPDGAPEGAFSWEDMDEAVAQIDRSLEHDGLPQSFLDDLGTDRRRLADLVERYKRFRRDLAETGAAEPFRPGARPSEPGTVLQRSVAADGMMVEDGAPVDRSPDTLRSRFSGAPDLSPRYRSVVERYYKALTEEQ